MPVSGTNSENQNSRVLIKELVVNGVPFTPATSEIVALGGTITGATANDTMTAVADAVAATTDITAASLTSVNTAIASIENNFADVQAKINEIITLLNAQA